MEIAHTGGERVSASHQGDFSGDLVNCVLFDRAVDWHFLELENECKAGGSRETEEKRIWEKKAKTIGREVWEESFHSVLSVSIIKKFITFNLSPEVEYIHCEAARLHAIHSHCSQQLSNESRKRPKRKYNISPMDGERRNKVKTKKRVVEFTYYTSQRR